MKIAAQALTIGAGDDAPLADANSQSHAAIDVYDSFVVLPGGSWPLNAEFVRQGPDLLVSGRAGESFVVRDYFMQESPAELRTEGGAVLKGTLVERLTGTPAPGQYAQGASTDEAETVGRVETVVGRATALRADGTEVTLTAGDPVLLGDVLQTGGDASLGIVFADKTTLSLGSEGRMVVDDFVYNPQANAGGMDINIVQGVFTFVSGEIAKVGPDAMTVHTPVATVGIRGTKVAGRAAAEGEQNTISLLPNDDGTVGVIAVGNQSGAVPQILTNAGATTTVFSQFQPPAPQIVFSPSQIQQQYGTALQTLSSTQQSVQTRQEAQPDQGTEAEGDSQAAPGEGEGEESSDDQGAAESQPEGEGQAEGEGLSEEEQAARDAAEAAAQDGETPEGALEAAIEAAADRALAEGATPEEVAEAEAAAREAFGEALENGESPEAALEAAMETVGEAEFTQLGEGGPDQGGLPPGGLQLAQGPGGDGQDEVLGAAESAAEQALSEGASEEEAFDAAVRAAMDAAIARGEDPEEVERIADSVREAHADAVESGIDPNAGAVEMVQTL